MATTETRGGSESPFKGLFEVPTSCVLDQNPAHQLRRRGEEVSPILPAHPLVVDQAYVGFIHERSCLKTAVEPLPRNVAVRKPAELRVDVGVKPWSARSSPSLQARSISLTSSAILHSW